MQCNQDLRLAGHLYPRTCSICNLGPCRHYPRQQSVGLPAPPGWKFQFGDRVRETGETSWQGHVCGFYSTSKTPENYVVINKNNNYYTTRLFAANTLEKVED